jgi:thiamine transport system substrate-binding protein
MIQSIFILVSFLYSVVSYAENKTLNVYTYDSFISKWGPGNSIKTSFEAQCNCNVKWFPVADGAALIARLKIEGALTKADVVIGIDDALTATAEATGLLDMANVTLPKSDIPTEFKTSSIFVPYDYGYYSFMVDTKSKNKSGEPIQHPKSMEELISSPQFLKSIIIQDPRTSAPGLGLLLWLHSLYGSKTGDALKKLQKNTLTVSTSWSQSYGLFTKGEAPFVLSYSTSEAYHRDSEKTDRYQSMIFPEGHYLSVETAAILKSSSQKALARQFLTHLLQNSSQGEIASKNWMYPVISLQNGIPPSFKNLSKPQKSLRINPVDVMNHKAKWTNEWIEIFSK